MVVKKIVLFLTFLYLGSCDSFSVESLQKCSYKDSTCQKDLFQSVIKSIGSTGIPSLGIKSIEPIILKNVSVSVLNLVNLTMVDGIVKGIGKCEVNMFEMDLEKYRASQAITCDLLIKGQYSLSANSPLVKDLLGDGSVSGEGNGHVKLEKIYISLEFPFYPVKHDDGEVYMKCLNKDIVYNYDLKGKASFAANNIYVGKDNVSELVVKYLNEQYKTLMQTFGKAFIDKAVDYFFDFAQKFYDGVPTKHYIIEDMTPFMKN